MDTSKYNSFFSRQLAQEPLSEIRKFLNFTETQENQLKALYPLAERVMKKVIDEFYSYVLTFPNIQNFFPTQELIADMKGRNTKQTLRMFHGPWDESYFIFRMHIGAVHFLVKLPPLLYISALSQMKTSLITQITAAKGSPLSPVEREAIESICQVELYLTLNTYFLIHQSHIEEARQQTAEILNNLSEAFFDINPDLTIGPVCSAACVPLLGHNPARMPLSQALPINKRAMEGLAVLLDQVFQNFLPLDVSLAMLPEKLLTPDGRTLLVRYTPVCDAQDEPKKIICAVSDVTGYEKQKEAMERESQHKNALLTILRFRPSFLNFVQEAREGLSHFHKGISAQEAKRVLHTLKGSGASYGLTQWAQRIHAIEDSLEAQTPLGTIGHELNGLLQEFLKDNFDILGIHPQEQGPPAVEVPLTQLEELDSLAMAIADPHIKQKLQSFSRTLRKKPVSQFLGPYSTLIEQLSLRLGKKVHWEVVGSQLKVMPNAVGGFFQNMVHALRNAVDHGIESPDERVEAGKPPEGTIRLVCEAFPQEPSTLSISIEDNGRGINTAKLREKAVAKGLATQTEINTWPQEQVWSLIFADDISTAETVTEVSGRGVGLAALLKEVQNNGGSVAIDSTPGQGTRLTFHVPHAL